MTGPTADMAWHADEGSAAAAIGSRRERGSASRPTGISNTKARWPSSPVPAGGTQTLPGPWQLPDRRRVKVRLSDPGTVHRGLEPVPDPAHSGGSALQGAPPFSVQATVQGSRVSLATAGLLYGADLRARLKLPLDPCSRTPLRSQ
jgi:hypothetical protein